MMCNPINLLKLTCTEHMETVWAAVCNVTDNLDVSELSLESLPNRLIRVAKVVNSQVVQQSLATWCALVVLK